MIFGSVLERVFDEFQNMPIGQHIVNVATVSASRYESFHAEQAQAVRHRGDPLAGRLGEFADTCLARHQQVQRAEAGLVA